MFFFYCLSNYNDNANIFLDDMHSHGCDGRRRPSLTLDAGYVSVPSTNIYETSEVIGLHGKKLICLLLTIISLVFISFINLIVSDCYFCIY